MAAMATTVAMVTSPSGNTTVAVSSSRVTSLASLSSPARPMPHSRATAAAVVEASAVVVVPSPVASGAVVIPSVNGCSLFLLRLFQIVF
jgi:hypothetical protein